MAMKSPEFLHIPSDLRERYVELSKAIGCTSPQLMLEALTDYVERKEKKLSFIKKAIKAEKRYRETGLHVTADECIEWLESCRTSEEKYTPELHN